MDFDDQLRRYFGTTDIGSIPPRAFEPGIERMKVDLGLETDRGRRFALWALMHMLGDAPDLDVAFQTRWIVKRPATSWTWPIKPTAERLWGGSLVRREALHLDRKILSLGAARRNLDRVLLLPLGPGHGPVRRFDNLVIQRH